MSVRERRAAGLTGTISGVPPGVHRLGLCRTFEGMLLRSSRVLDKIAIIEALWRRYGVDLAYEQVIERSYRQFLRHGDTVIDVGAHTGTHTSVFLDIVGPSGRVIAFEPLPDLCAGLRARLGPAHPNLTVLQLALSSAPATEAAFVRAEGSLAESGLRQREYNDPDAVQPAVIQVAVDKIDALADRLALTSLAYIKMDIEGGELDALEGAYETVRRFRPVISVEFGGQAYRAYGHQEDSLFETARRIGYRIHDPFMQFIGSRRLWDHAKSRYCWDYFLVPAERVREARRWCLLP